VRRPYSESCEQNREPILEILQRCLHDAESVLEIGSGTGQHAVYFAPQFPNLIWQTSDRRENHPGIMAWIDEMPADNIRLPLSLDVSADVWPQRCFDVVFSANTAHIMGEPDVTAMFNGAGRVLSAGGRFILYGPFNIGGRYTAPSNERFDQWLKAQDPRMGVRDRGWLEGLAKAAGMQLEETIDMPADNKTLVWIKP
jgi:cyclopropane fatty-acyl-phospholipid synthase-like methyltransferase